MILKTYARSAGMYHKYLIIRINDGSDIQVLCHPALIVNINRVIGVHVRRS